MRTRPLGRTGIQVSAYCLGTMMFGQAGNPDRDDCVRIVHRALDAGINVIDTADVYGPHGLSEEIVGAALAGRRADVVLATKVNGPDPRTDIEETLAALTDLVRSGKVRAIGTSNLPAAEIVEVRWVADRHGLRRFRTEQPTYSVLNRGIEREVLPTCQRHGMGVLVWSPLAMTFATTHPGVTSAIIGQRTMEHLDDLLAGAEVALDDDVLDRIDRIVPPGTDLGPLDVSYVPPAVEHAALRRRSAAERAAA